MEGKFIVQNMEHETLVGNTAEIFHVYTAAASVQKFYLVHQFLRGTASDGSCLPCCPVS